MGPRRLGTGGNLEEGHLSGLELRRASRPVLGSRGDRFAQSLAVAVVGKDVVARGRRQPKAEIALHDDRSGLLTVIQNDHQEAIGKLSDGLWVTTGHEGAGVGLGPISGQLLAEAISGEPPRFDLTPFDPQRFA